MVEKHVLRREVLREFQVNAANDAFKVRPAVGDAPAKIDGLEAEARILAELRQLGPNAALQCVALFDLVGEGGTDEDAGGFAGQEHFNVLQRFVEPVLELFLHPDPFPREVVRNFLCSIEKADFRNQFECGTAIVFGKHVA